MRPFYDEYGWDAENQAFHPCFMYTVRLMICNMEIQKEKCTFNKEW